MNNAGAIVLTRQRTADGIELTFALNHLGYFLLTCLLLDTLKASAPARIVKRVLRRPSTRHLELDDLQCQREYRGFWAYARSKLANLLFTYELDRRLGGTGVTVNTLHPRVGGHQFPKQQREWSAKFSACFCLSEGSARSGAPTPRVYLASSRDVEGVSGQYFVERIPAVSRSPLMTGNSLSDCGEPVLS